MVYHFKCYFDSCNDIYIGFTTQELELRMKQHCYKGAIKLHISEKHNDNIDFTKTLDNTDVIFKSNRKVELQLVESYLIRLRNPVIIRRDEGLTKHIFIF